MTVAEFRRLALGLPEAVEKSHVHHPDFRVGGKIFATLGYPDERFGVVMLTPDEQQALLERYPETFSPAAGAWGRRGSTKVLLSTANSVVVKRAMQSAWRNKAPKRAQGLLPNE